MRRELPRPGRLVSIGGIPIDIVVRTDSVPVRGGDVRGEAVVDRPGGPYTVLSAARRLGLPAAYAGGYGAGVRGTEVKKHLLADGIEIVRTPSRDVDTGFSLVMVDSAGERTCVSTPGAEALRTASDVATYDPRPGDYLHLTGYDFADPAAPALLLLLEQLPEDVTVIFDPGPLAVSVPPGIPWSTLQRVLDRADIISLNEREAGLLVGDVDPAVVAAEFPSTWVIYRQGSAGAWLIDSGHIVEHAPAIPVVVRDTTGAGDVHTGAFVAALAETGNPRAALRIATVAASLSTRSDGPGTGPTRDEVTAVLARQP